MAKLEAADLSLQDDPYTLANDGRFSQAGLKFEYDHISAALFSDWGSTFRSSSFPDHGSLPRP